MYVCIYVFNTKTVRHSLFGFRLLSQGHLHPVHSCANIIATIPVIIIIIITSIIIIIITTASRARKLSFENHASRTWLQTQEVCRLQCDVAHKVWLRIIVMIKNVNLDVLGFSFRNSESDSGRFRPSAFENTRYMCTQRDKVTERVDFFSKK